MIYFDNAATTFPKPDLVLDEMYNFMKSEMANPGRSGHKMAMETAKKIFNVRIKLANIMGINNPLQIIFTKNTSEALNMAILGVIKENDHIITSTMEHNSVIRPLYKMQQDNKITLTVVDSDDEGFVYMDKILNSINESTKLIVITHSSNLLGSINDVEFLGNKIKEINKNRKNKIIFMVDCAQTAGYVDINVEKMKIDILAGAGHKGLYGPTGTGFLYVSEEINISPVFVGGTGSLSESLLQPDFMPDMLETGTLNAVGIVGLGAGLDYIKEKGLDAIKSNYQELVAYTIKELEKIKNIKIYGSKNEKMRSSVVCFNVGDIGSQEVVSILSEEYDIATRGALHCAVLAHKRMNTVEQGMVRVSFSTFNKKEEVDLLIKAIKDIINKNIFCES